MHADRSASKGKWMLRKLKISRFKSIYSDELEFGQVNLFIGPNGSGKSNILEALGIIAAIFSRGIDPNELDLKVASVKVV